MKYISLFLSLLIFNSIYSIDSYQANEILNVLTISGIRLWDEPEGNVLQKVPYGARVVTLESKNFNYPKTMEGIKGAWVKVNFNGNVGYVFDGFLSGLPAPSLSDDLQSYVKREFKLLSNEMPLSFHKDDDIGSTGNDVLFLEWKNRQCAYENHFYANGGGENLCIPGASMEEAYLLMRIIKRDFYEVARKAAANSKGFDKSPYVMFVLNGVSYYNNGIGHETEKHDYYECDLSDYCDYQLTITNHNGYVLINFDGACDVGGC